MPGSCLAAGAVGLPQTARLDFVMRDRYTRYPRPILWLIPGGETRIGGAEADAQPCFHADLAPFYLSKFPVSNEQFEAFNPAHERSPISLGDTDPVVGVSGSEADEYCDWYAHVTRKPMRLPTEAEWEHACRAGFEGRFFFDDDLEEADLYLWDADNSAGILHRAQEKKANGFGLFGMLGGLWEWTASSYRAYPLTQPTPEAEGDELRVLRGGSFRTPRKEISCSLRHACNPKTIISDSGFRIAKNLR